MASDKKRAANRRNARKSTGPRSVRGKMIVGQNAVKHGLTRPATADPTYVHRIDRLSRAFAAEHVLSPAQVHAKAAAEAHFDIVREREAETKLIQAYLDSLTEKSSAEVEQEGPDHGPQTHDQFITALRRLKRYERRALARLRRALTMLTQAPARA